MKTNDQNHQTRSKRADCYIISLLAICLWLPLVGQEAAKPSPKASGPKNGILLVVGYEMDKARADAVLQSQDMTGNVKSLVEKLEQLSKAKGAARVNCAAQTISSGMRTTLDMGTAVYEFEPIISPALTLSLNLQRKVKLSGIESTGTVTLSIGEYAYIGTVPDVKQGKDALLFARMVMHYLGN